MPNLKEINIDIENKINASNIEELLKEPNPFKLDSPAFYFYSKLMQYNFDERFSDEFIERAYACLVAWGMDSQKAKLEYFDNFKKSIIDSKDIFESLKNSKLENINDTDFDNLHQLFKNLKISKTHAKLVGFSKLLHFFLPDLVSPIDRTYTMNFFYPKDETDTNKNATSYFPSGDIENQFTVFEQIHEIYRDFANSHNLTQYISSEGWNRNVPKIIDNLVMAAVRKNKKTNS